MLLVLGVNLLFPSTAKSPLLGNYRRARYALAAAYLFFAAVNAAEYLFSGSVSDVPLIRTIVLAVAASQAFLFTITMLALLETRFPGWRPIFREAALALLLIIAVFTVYTACSEACFDVAFWIFAGMYALLLVRYTFLFRRNYRRFRRRMDNCFFGNEADWMRWVVFSFCAALVIGVMALLTTVFTSTITALIFTVVYDTFYIFFAIRFVDYAARFPAIEEAMENDDPVEAEETGPEAGETIAAGGKTAARFVELERRIEQWVADKGYTEKNVTANALVPVFYTNRRYLSAYINTHKKKTFNQWVNELRIEEAKRLLARHPDMSVGEVASKVGFVNASHFGKIFLALAKSSPKVWRASSSGKD
ncbi:MAG: helix-turn-helix domain-containing protein [Rikenellaceae bacterium]|jgi:AraC-like DNA-binding protein|nr:helix-turn-helix domain-containing protein [Rikenellaceae bacterium]